MNLSEEDKKRFWSKVDVRGPDECWFWKAGINEDGYGNFSLNYKTVSAHRVSHELAIGTISPGMIVLHKCDNRPCCNPKHLYQGTHGDNNLDREHRNPGTSGRQSKVGAIGIVHIKRLREQGLTYRAISQLYNLSECQISRLCRGISGKHTIEVEGE